MMTSRERVARALARTPVDHAPVFDSIWKETADAWRQQGHLGADEDVAEHFGMDMRLAGWINCTADLDFVPQVIEETDETIVTRDGNGAIFRRHKHHTTTPEHVGFAVTERAGWETLIKPHLLEVDRRRIPFEEYRRERRFAAARNRFFAWHGIAPFEQMHPVCGHEHMLVGMALDPEWVKDMVMTYTRFTINHLEVLFAEEGLPDGAWVYEDMGYKFKPFMSPAMYREIIQPGHARLFEFFHSRGLKIILHSCGFVEPLVPGLIEAGMDCLEAMEVKAGMDMRRLAKMYGDRIAFMGNIDERVLESNDHARIDAELEAKLPCVRHGGYILQSDHSISTAVRHDTLHYFFERGREMTAGA